MALNDYQRVEKAILFLEDNFLDQPNLNHVAAHLQLSDFHFQRLFKRWAGISPKRFLQFLTVEYAKQLLQNSRSVLDVSYDVGLSGPGRLHDLLISVDAVTPGQFKSSGTDLLIAYGFHDTPFGECFIAMTERGICGMEFVTSDRDEILSRCVDCWSAAEFQANPAATKEIVNRVFWPVEKEPSARQFNLVLKGTNFQLKVWRALLDIPLACAVTYEGVARRIGQPTAARAVGAAIARNPIAYLIPCHRVIRKTGEVTDYRWGTVKKRAIIGWEAARSESELEVFAASRKRELSYHQPRKR